MLVESTAVHLGCLSFRAGHPLGQCNAQGCPRTINILTEKRNDVFNGGSGNIMFILLKVFDSVVVLIEELCGFWDKFLDCRRDLDVLL